ncbi:hypothetical protein BJV82DRAFT_628141 [Fennellomyces sp. T-0311]|nr:hypothetical protein BJV82DRAFT_628141 [Fennellomyces sp. T-0311]
MRKDLGHIHQKLMSIEKESDQIAQTKYTEDDVRKLQDKLASIDAEYNEGIIDDRDKNNWQDDPYEHDGQAQVADELSKAHNKLHMMLTSMEK